MKKVLIISLISAFALAPSAWAVKAEVETRGQKTQVAESIGETVRQRIQDLKEARAEKREKIKAEILEKVKERAEKAIDRAERKYTQVKTRVQNMPNVTDEQKTAFATKVDAEITKIDALKAEVAASTTVEEVKAVMTKLKTEYKYSVNAVKEAVKVIRASHLTKTIEKLEGIMTRLDEKVTTAKTAGKDVTEMEKLQGEAKTALEAAKTATTSYDFKEAKDQILAARKAMVKLSQELKAGATADQEEGEE